MLLLPRIQDLVIWLRRTAIYSVDWFICFFSFY